MHDVVAVSGLRVETGMGKRENRMRMEKGVVKRCNSEVSLEEVATKRELEREVGRFLDRVVSVCGREGRRACS